MGEIWQAALHSELWALLDKRRGPLWRTDFARQSAFLHGFVVWPLARKERFPNTCLVSSGPFFLSARRATTPATSGSPCRRRTIMSLSRAGGVVPAPAPGSAHGDPELPVAEAIWSAGIDVGFRPFSRVHFGSEPVLRAGPRFFGRCNLLR
jgi:hypothetical protein